MTNVVAVTGTPQMATAATMTAKDKGSFGNRVDCAWAHTVNNVKYTAKGAATLAAGAGAAYGVHKMAQAVGHPYLGTGSAIREGVASANKWLNSNIAKAADKLIVKTKVLGRGKVLSPEVEKLLPHKYECGKLGEIAHKVLDKLSKTSGKTKALALIGTLTAATMLYLTRAQAFKAGQIDQKYTDRAKAQEVAK